MFRPVRNELSREDQEELMKKLLHEQGKCLLIYPQGSNTTLLTALAETIHTNDETLHLKLCEKLDHDIKSFTLPKRLSYIYDDKTLSQDFRKYPELVNFAKIILQLFSASTERRINMFGLVTGGEQTYYLNSRVINAGGYKQQISIGKIQNKYYNITENHIQSKKELSIEDVFKSSPHIDSEQLIETFKPEVRQKITKPINIESEQKKEKPRFEQIKPGKLLETLQAPDLLLKRAKSSIPFKNEQKSISKEFGIQYDRSSMGETQSLNEDIQLINQCGPGHEGFEGYHHGIMPGMQGVMTPEQLYYMYYPSSYYHQQMPIHSMSPQKSSPYKAPPTQISGVPAYYTPPNYAQTAATAQNSETKRYTGRLKFFDDAKNYGFIIMDADESDIFVHYDDLQKAGISKDVIKTFKNEMYMQIRFSYKVMQYFGKYKKSRKAVELNIIGQTLSLLTQGYPLPE